MVTPETITDTTQDETILLPEEPTPEEPTPFLTPEDYRSVCDDYEFETIPNSV